MPRTEIESNAGGRACSRGRVRRLLVCAAGVAMAAALPLACAPAPSAVTPSNALADEDGHELWLRYPRVADAERLAAYQSALSQLVVSGSSPTIGAVRQELTRGLSGLLGGEVSAAEHCSGPGALVVGTPATSEVVAAQPGAAALGALGPEGYSITSTGVGCERAIVIAASSDIGLLYGSFRFLRELQTERPIDALAIESKPAIELRMLNHWDNLDRSVERGYAGPSLWDWEQLPDTLSPRYVDYARANASLGINATVLTNVNANAQVLTPPYLAKVRALADVFRPYGIRVYLTARFSAPIEIGGLETADPLAPEVRRFWAAKAAEIYALIPDFGGFLVKANSEGQPGPREYGRSHAEGANVLADALGSRGTVIWRAFVYSSESPVDRIRQAYDEFQPLDGAFRPNVFVQVKNGPLDFQPREPFHPLFGAMPRTPLALELQITKEYLGQDTHLVYLGPLFEEALKADTHAQGAGSTLARVIDGTLHGQARSAIAGVANVGTDDNWTGSHFNQANWYAYGRLAWDPTASAEDIAEEWTRATFSNRPPVVSAIQQILMASHQANVDYMTPLGLVHIMATSHHYGPGPWVSDLNRPEWNPTYYHRADATGLGFDRTATGSNAVEQYFAPVREQFADRRRVPDAFLLYFHHVGWTERLHSGRTLWDELVFRYNEGVRQVRAMRGSWSELRGEVDRRRFDEVAAFLQIQEDEARWWRDAALVYFQTFSKQPIPTEYEQPAFTLEQYQAIARVCPPDRDKPRCPQVYRDPL